MVSVADFLGLEKRKILLKMFNILQKGQRAKNADDLELG